MAKLLQTRLRTTDIACRYGGEEFTAILVDTGRNDAKAVADELRALVESERFTSQETELPLRVTVSIGVSTFPEDATDPETLVRSADEAMYRAKQGGRNRVVAAEPVVPT